MIKEVRHNSGIQTVALLTFVRSMQQNMNTTHKHVIESMK